MILTLPSGIEVTQANLYRYISKLTTEDIKTILGDKRFISLRNSLKSFLGQTFANAYRKRRMTKSGRDLDWWKLHGGKFQKIFSEAATRAKSHGLDPLNLIYISERLARSRGLDFPPPQLVCGPWAFAELFNMCFVEKKIPQKQSNLIPEEHGESTWIWQPGYSWCCKKGEFVK